MEYIALIVGLLLFVEHMLLLRKLNAILKGERVLNARMAIVERRLGGWMKRNDTIRMDEKVTVAERLPK